MGPRRPSSTPSIASMASMGARRPEPPRRRAGRGPLRVVAVTGAAGAVVAVLVAVLTAITADGPESAVRGVHRAVADRDCDRLWELVRAPKGAEKARLCRQVFGAAGFAAAPTNVEITDSGDRRATLRVTTADGETTRSMVRDGEDWKVDLAGLDLDDDGSDRSVDKAQRAAELAEMRADTPEGAVALFYAATAAGDCDRSLEVLYEPELGPGSKKEAKASYCRFLQTIVLDAVSVESLPEPNVAGYEGEKLALVDLGDGVIVEVHLVDGRWRVDFSSAAGR